MGLDVSHDCFSGSYGRFFRFRAAVANAANACTGLTTQQDHQLARFLEHSDCDGDIPWADCGFMADALEKVTPLLGEEVDHNGDLDVWQSYAVDFVRGLRLAHSNREDVKFG